MSTTDGYGQGISLASLTDGPDLPKAIADLANGVIPRGVMRFASASTRGATLTSPVEGMLSYLQDVDRLDLYTGATWLAVSTGVSSWTTISPAATLSQDGNSNGIFQYRLLNISGEESIQFRGALARSYSGTPASSIVVNTTALPSAVRPSTLRTVLVPCSDTSSDRIALKMDIRTDGYLEVFGFSSSVKPPWIGFNGVICSL